MWYRLRRADARTGSSPHLRALRARRRRLDAEQAKARAVLGDELYKRVRRQAIYAHHTWEESPVVFHCALARLFYIARREIAAGKWTPPGGVPIIVPIP